MFKFACLSSRSTFLQLCTTHFAQKQFDGNATQRTKRRGIPSMMPAILLRGFAAFVWATISFGKLSLYHPKWTTWICVAVSGILNYRTFFIFMTFTLITITYQLGPMALFSSFFTPIFCFFTKCWKFRSEMVIPKILTISGHIFYLILIRWNTNGTILRLVIRWWFRFEYVPQGCYARDLSVPIRRVFCGSWLLRQPIPRCAWLPSHADFHMQVEFFDPMFSQKTVSNLKLHFNETKLKKRLNQIHVNIVLMDLVIKLQSLAWNNCTLKSFLYSLGLRDKRKLW